MNYPIKKISNHQTCILGFIIRIFDNHVVVDDISYKFIKGSELEWTEELVGSQFELSKLFNN